MPVASSIIRYTPGLAFAGLTVFLGYFLRRSDFVPFITAYGAFFGLYFWLIFFKKNMNAAELRWYVALGIALRALLLFSIPNLSDDFYRFLWDGHLTVAGIHPFTHPPVYFIENHLLPEGVLPELFSKLNSPEYFTVYPPVCQAVFALAAWLGQDSIWAGVVLIKLFLLVCEVGTIWGLGIGDWGLRIVDYGFTDNDIKKSVPNSQSAIPNPQLLYALNPLIILEITGNCHFEGAMICFLVAGLRALGNKKIEWGALWWALATASKLLPLLFLPVVWRWLGWRKGAVFIAVFAGFCVVLLAPLWSVVPNILSSLDLYFRQFQFNASVYYLLRGFGFWVKGYDIGESLGPLLGMAVLIGVLAIASKTKPSRWWQSERAGIPFASAILFALFLHLSFSATVHPWYITVPFAIGLLTHWRFPVIWTGVAALSYSHYAGGSFQENFWLIALEYSVLWLYILWETSPITPRRRTS
ncbi:MAG: hypothetical protein EPGJADBJ_02209 [Saprospiraceae bacterium]|nr:hypothetical protein [Saprospiraceae bacterium]